MVKFLKEKWFAILLLSVIFVLSSLWWTSNIHHYQDTRAYIQLGFPLDYYSQDHSQEDLYFMTVDRSEGLKLGGNISYPSSFSWSLFLANIALVQVTFLVILFFVYSFIPRADYYFRFLSARNIILGFIFYILATLGHIFLPSTLAGVEVPIRISPEMQKPVILPPPPYIPSPAQETITSSPVSSPIVKSGLNTYHNPSYKFSIQYPAYYETSKTQTPNLFVADSSTDEIRIEVIDKPLDGRIFVASDGMVGDSILKYSATKDIWEYLGMGGFSDFSIENYKVLDVRPDDLPSLIDEGYVPVKYKTKSGLTAWVGNSTNQHSTQGGDTWQIAFIESSQKQFTVRLYMKQCRGLYNSCNASEGPYLEPAGNSQTIFSVIDTLQFLK